MTASIVGTTASSIGGGQNSVGSGPKSRGGGGGAGSSYWKPLPFLSTPRQDAACTVVDLSSSTQAVVVAGGRNKHSPSLHQVELLEWNVQRRWFQLPPTQTARCGCALVALGRRLYIMGGINGESQPQSTMETLEVMGPVHQWTTVAEPMATPRMYPGAVAFGEGHKQVILVVGGRDQSWQELNSCELYTVETGKWEEVLSMNNRRFGCGLVYLKSVESVMAVGGYDGSEWTTSCELYDPAKDTWTETPPMPRAVQFCAATVMTNADTKEEYVVVRGRPAVSSSNDDDINDDDDDDGDLSMVGLLQCYSLSSQQWIILPPKSETMGAAVTCIDQSRLLVLGGGSGEDLEATSMCRFWMASSLTKLFMERENGAAGANGDATSVGNSSLPQPPMMSPVGQQQQRKQRADGGGGGGGGGGGEDEDEESTVHPFLRAPPLPSGTISLASASTSHTATSRRKAENESILDYLGVEVKFTGYLAKESGHPHGKGLMTWPLTGDRYEGRFEHGARQGRGHMMYHNSDTFLGYFRNDQREGMGSYQYRDGRTYDGLYVNDMAQDTQGKMRWKDGTTYVGEFLKGKRTGRGKLLFANSNIEYDGDFVNGKYHGQGMCRFADGSIYQGQWKHGKAHGKGRLTDAQGSIVHDGKWANDGPVYT